jgi:hypothetical protein
MNLEANLACISLQVIARKTGKFNNGEVKRLRNVNENK